MRQRKGNKMYRIATAACAAGVALAASQAMSGPLQENLTHQETRKCTEWEFTVFGIFEDLQVLRGASGWIEIESPEVEMFCGEFTEYISCPPDTRYLWVTRTGVFEVFLACYR